MSTAARVITRVFLHAAVVLTVTALFMARLFVHNDRMDLQDMLAGTAHRPFAYRVLVPELVRATTTFTSALATRVGVHPWDTPIAKLGARVLTDIGAADLAHDWSLEYGLYVLLVALAFLGCLLAMRALARACYPKLPEFVAEFGALMALVVMPFLCFRARNELYDPLTLCLFALALLCLQRRALAAYLVVFLLATLNKETAILLVGAYVVRERGVSSSGRVAALAALQVTLFVALKAWLGARLGGLPGAVFEQHLAYNFRMSFRDPTLYPKLLATLVPLGVLIAHAWRRKPVVLRQWLAVLGLPLVAGLLVVGLVGELRALDELYPLAFVLALPSVVELFGMASLADAQGAT